MISNSIESKRLQVHESINDPNNLLIIAGPCSDQLDPAINTEGEVLSGLEDINTTVVHRRRLFKPRSNPLDWSGLISSNPKEASRNLAEVNKGDVKIAQEVGGTALNTIIESSAFGWIGSRAVGNLALQDVLIENSDLPVGIKNSMDGSIGEALNIIQHIATQRPENISLPLLIFRGGSEIRSPSEWANAVVDAAEAVDRSTHCGGLIIDVAHGSEMAHDPRREMNKTVHGQIAAITHLIALLRSGRLSSEQLAGIMMEASDVNPTSERTTDPNIPIHKALGLIGTLEEAVCNSKFRPLATL